MHTTQAVDVPWLVAEIENCRHTYRIEVDGDLWFCTDKLDVAERWLVQLRRGMPEGVGIEHVRLVKHE